MHGSTMGNFSHSLFHHNHPCTTNVDVCCTFVLDVAVAAYFLLIVFHSLCRWFGPGFGGGNSGKIEERWRRNFRDCRGVRRRGNRNRSLVTSLISKLCICCKDLQALLFPTANPHNNIVIRYHLYLPCCPM